MIYKVMHDLNESLLMDTINQSVQCSTNEVYFIQRMR